MDGGRRTDIGFDRPAGFAFGKCVGHAVAGEKRRLIVDMHVQMRLERTAGIADMAEDLADADMIAGFT